MNSDNKLLYRKVNTKARNVHHNFGSDAKYDRNTKKGLKKTMSQGEQRGLDYTPLYKFLLSKVGQNWDEVHSEAVSKLDSENPIWNLVIDIDSDSNKGYTYCGESSIYSTLYVDDNNTLQLVNPLLKNEDFKPSCPCCTFTFNGKFLNKKYKINPNSYTQVVVSSLI